ncbi:MAG: sulfotransferase [Planctomycetota bacterium]
MRAFSANPELLFRDPSHLSPAGIQRLAQLFAKTILESNIPPVTGLHIEIEGKKLMKVIGAGFGRTGTMSMQAALEILGYRCYHMKEVTEHEGHLRAWHEHVAGRSPMDWKSLFKDFEATVDFPACLYYRSRCASSRPKWSSTFANPTAGSTAS